jgi:hypothetical protein
VLDGTLSVQAHDRVGLSLSAALHGRRRSAESAPRRKLLEPGHDEYRLHGRLYLPARRLDCSAEVCCCKPFFFYCVLLVTI